MTRVNNWGRWKKSEMSSGEYRPAKIAIWEYLRKQGEPKSVQEIMDAIGLSYGTVYQALNYELGVMFMRTEGKKWVIKA